MAWRARQRYQRFSGVPVQLTRMYVTQYESEIAEQLNELLHEFPDLMLGSYPRLGEEDYRVYRGTEKDPVTFPPGLVGLSGGPDVTTYTDAGSPVAPGMWIYKVRGVGACGAELATW